MFKVFLNDAYRLLKIKTHQKKQKDASNSGFMRPVKPSIALEKFLAHIGENTTQPLTRAHLTTIICKYIKENDLQNPEDRRIIFPDEEFKKLFQITENETEPLTYYNIQKRIQSHVSRIE
jgi:chromatin remodeling complex protein RSC6